MSTTSTSGAGAARRRGVPFINPGGPGVPAMEQVLIGQLVPGEAADYDLIGMDPRFVGRNTPLNCRWSTDTFLRSAGPDRRSFDRFAHLYDDSADSYAALATDVAVFARAAGGRRSRRPESTMESPR